jgi:hypothetical protein
MDVVLFTKELLFSSYILYLYLTGGKTMAHFRGTVTGDKGEASRLGHKSTGLHVKANSWEGAIEVDLHYNKAQDCDIATVTLVPANNNSPVTLFTGRIDGKENN